jgi:hypothetical protein
VAEAVDVENYALIDSFPHADYEGEKQQDTKNPFH